MRGQPPRKLLAGLAGCSDQAIDLAGTALALSALDRPAAHIEDYFPHIDSVAADLADSGAADDADGLAATLAAVMARRHFYRSDDRDDDEVANTSLMWVIDNRRGTAEALGILALAAARRVGWRAEGLAFPAHFLLRIEDSAGGRAILDPFRAWQVVDPPEMRALLKAASGLDAELAPSHYAALDNRAILVRLQNAAKVRLLRCGCIARALAVVEATLLFAPDQPLLWREAGLMHMRLDQLPAAVAALEQFVARTGNPQARRRTVELLQHLRGRLS